MSKEIMIYKLEGGDLLFVRNVAGAAMVIHGSVTPQGARASDLARALVARAFDVLRAEAMMGNPNGELTPTEEQIAKELAVDGEQMKEQKARNRERYGVPPGEPHDADPVGALVEKRWAALVDRTKMKPGKLWP